MMKRRNFLKSASGLWAACGMPLTYSVSGMMSAAHAAPIPYDAADLSFTAPNVMPQIINIFLYGGPSELAGNLTNILEIEQHSFSRYPDFLVNKNGSSDPANWTLGEAVTQNGFWGNDSNGDNGAGGNIMESMLANNQMTMFRTLFRRQNQTRSHRESIFINQKGNINVEGTPGIGTRVAQLFDKLNFSNSQFADGTSVGNVQDQLVLPFISFERNSTAFAPDTEFPLDDLRLRALDMDTNFDNPFSRRANPLVNDQGRETSLEALAQAQANAAGGRFAQARLSLNERDQMDNNITNLDLDANTRTFGANYPDTNSGRAIRAAVTLAVENPQSLFISVGNAFGGWDDHNSSFDRYPDNMTAVMESLQAAANHIQSANNASINGRTRTTDNIVINVFGEFGRLANLNGSEGWDHGNNQILYTLGGTAYNRQMGKLIGRTEIGGNRGTNNMFMQPLTTGSQADGFSIEPMSIAASTYSYFGVSDPRIITNNEMPIDFSQPSVRV